MLNMCQHACNGWGGSFGTLVRLSLFSVISLDKDLVLRSGILLTPNLFPKIKRLRDGKELNNKEYIRGLSKLRLPTNGYLGLITF